MYWKEALTTDKINEAVDFRDEMVPVADVIQLGKKGVRVPQELILYPDDKDLIDESEFPEVTDEAIAKGELVIGRPVFFMLEEKKHEFIKSRGLDVQKLFNQFIESLMLKGTAI